MRSFFNQFVPAQDCLLCAAACGRRSLCPRCEATLPQLDGPLCPLCAQPLPGGAQHPCGECLRHLPPWQGTLAAWRYGFPLDRMIQALKYRHHFGVIEPLVEPLAQLAAARPLPDALLAMPLHRARQRSRGYNQSLLIARALSGRLGVPLLHHACRRTRDTRPQAGLTPTQRRSNLRRAFVCNPCVQGLNIAIVDDIMTSGASLAQLSGALSECGAQRIECWVLARALRTGAS